MKMTLITLLIIVIAAVTAHYLWPMSDAASVPKDLALPASTSESDDRVSEKKVNTSHLPVLGQAPDLVGLENWINTEPISSLSELRGKVVLADFWTFSCINCIRTLPHVQALHEKYGDDGLVVLGLHAPEFAYEKKIENVRDAVTKYGLTYPIAQDNDFQTWRAYKNRYWPAHYLIDKEGNVRYTHFGEGKYQEMDDNVALLLAE